MEKPCQRAIFVNIRINCSLAPIIKFSHSLITGITMNSKTFEKDMTKMIDSDALESLSNITHLHVCQYASDAASAAREGAKLLAISRVDNDDDGDGFRYLIALFEGDTITPHLECFF